jgi:hypothetical protein
MWKYQQYKNFRKAQNEFAKNWFAKKDFVVQEKHSFILKNSSQWKENLILEKVADFIELTKKEYEEKKIPFPLHKYIHHGLSSQAMLFNLLGEATIKKDKDFFTSLFAFDDVVIDDDSELLFEYSDRTVFNEQQKQPTSFDFVIKNNNGKNIFLEAKYVETEFGKCSTIESGECDGMSPIYDIDSCYLTHCGRNYWNLMKKHNLSEPYKNSRICPFAIYYQFYRELLFAIERNGYFVILIDKRNPAFIKTDGVNERGLISVLTNPLSEQMKNIVKVIYIQDVVKLLEKFEYSWVNEFKNKYGLEE